MNKTLPSVLPLLSQFVFFVWIDVRPVVAPHWHAVLNQYNLCGTMILPMVEGKTDLQSQWRSTFDKTKRGQLSIRNSNSINQREETTPFFLHGKKKNKANRHRNETCLKIFPVSKSKCILIKNKRLWRAKNGKTKKLTSLKSKANVAHVRSTLSERLADLSTHLS